MKRTVLNDHAMKRTALNDEQSPGTPTLLTGMAMIMP